MQSRLLQVGSYQMEVSEFGNGPETILLVPGYSVPMMIWKKIFTRFTDYKVVSFNHLGRGHSDKPHVVHNLKLFTDQMLKLIDTLKIGPVHLVGTSMGGGIATQFSLAYPDKIKSLCLICPTGVSDPLGWDARLYGIPGIGTLVMTIFKKKLLEDAYEAFDDPDEELCQAIAEQTEMKGYFRSLSSTLRNFPWDQMAESYQKFSELGIPAHFIWGDQDRQVPISDLEILRSYMPRSTSKVIKGGRHNIIYNNPDVVVESMLGFLNSLRTTHSILG